MLGVGRVVEKNLIVQSFHKIHRETAPKNLQKTHIPKDEAWGPYAAKIFDLFSVPLDKRISLHESDGCNFFVLVEAGKLVGLKLVKVER